MGRVNKWVIKQHRKRKGKMTEKLLSIRGNNKEHEMREQTHQLVEPIYKSREKTNSGDQYILAKNYMIKSLQLTQK